MNSLTLNGKIILSLKLDENNFPFKYQYADSKLKRTKSLSFSIKNMREPNLHVYTVNLLRKSIVLDFINPFFCMIKYS